jgi:hypothetical protein
MDNVSIFREFLEKNNSPLKENSNEIGETSFVGRENFDNGGSINFLIIFNETGKIIDIIIAGIAEIKNPLKKETLLELVNEVNNQYRYIKVIENEGAIRMEYSFPASIGDNIFEPSIIMEFLFLMFDITKEVYPKFMKLQWG